VCPSGRRLRRIASGRGKRERKHTGESIKGSRAPLCRAQKAENAAYVAAELFSGGATPSLRSVFRQVSRTLRAPSTPHHKTPQARRLSGLLGS